MNKVLSVSAIILFFFCSLAIFTLWKYRQEMFQSRSRIFIWALVAIKLFFVMLHYTLGLSSYINIVFVIIQEFFKISAFLCVVFYYIKQAFDYTKEDNGSTLIKVVKIFLIWFDIALAITLTVWAVLRLTNVIDAEPWRDITWLLYRSVTLVLIIAIIIIGIVIQRKVMKKSTTLRMSLNCSSTLRKEFTINSLRQMWISFAMILFVCCFDVAYNIYWTVKVNPMDCMNYTDNDTINAFIFLIARSISLLLPFFPIMHCFIGWQLLTVLLCCCCRRFRNRKQQEFYGSKASSDCD